MLNDLKKMINAEAENDMIVDLMLEATMNSIADMFIADDGEIEMAESEIMDVLDKIPAYDEEAEMNKKLAKIAENYIPEELDLSVVEEDWDWDVDDYVEESFDELKQKLKDVKVKRDEVKKSKEIINHNKKVLKNMLNAAKTKDELIELKNLVNRLLDVDANHELRGTNKARDKKVDKFDKSLKTDFMKKIDKKMAKLTESYEGGAEMYDEFDDYLEEALFGKMRKMSDADLKAKIDELELQGNESGAKKYKKELEKRMRKEEKKKAKQGVEVPGTQPANVVAEDWDDFDEYLEEGLFSKRREAKLNELKTKLNEAKDNRDRFANNPYFNPADASDQVALGGFNAEIISIQKEIDKLEKKLGKKVAESYDDFDEYLEEALFGKMRKLSNEDLRAKIEELEAEGNNKEAGKYQKELNRRLRKDEKREARAAKKDAKKGGVDPEQQAATEDWDDFDEYLESLRSCDFDE
jgi:hypothetical protein